MRQAEAVRTLAGQDAQGRYVYLARDLAKLFPTETGAGLQASLGRLVDAGVLTRAVKGIYVYALSRHLGATTVEAIAKAMRRGQYSYVSLESALSEHGLISQAPVDRITIMTTGRKGEYPTPFGVIEFTHTKRPWLALLDCLLDVGRPLRLADKATAWRDLKRVGRNTHLVAEAEANDS